MQASVTTVFRSAIAVSSIPIRSASPAIACRTTATFSAFAGSDICSPAESTFVVLKFGPWRSGRSVPLSGRVRHRPRYRPDPRPDTQTYHPQTGRALRGLPALASRPVGPAPFQASASDLEGGVRLLEVLGELDLSTAMQLEEPLEEATQAADA